jgi:hypothetical protein
LAFTHSLWSDKKFNPTDDLKMKTWSIWIHERNWCTSKGSEGFLEAQTWFDFQLLVRKFELVGRMTEKVLAEKY